MAETNQIDEWHITVLVPDGLSDHEVEAVRRVLAGEEFANQLRRAVLDAFRAFPELAPSRVSLTR